MVSHLIGEFIHIHLHSDTLYLIIKTESLKNINRFVLFKSRFPPVVVHVPSLHFLSMRNFTIFAYCFTLIDDDDFAIFIHVSELKLLFSLFSPCNRIFFGERAQQQTHIDQIHGSGIAIASKVIESDLIETKENNFAIV